MARLMDIPLLFNLVLADIGLGETYKMNSTYGSRRSLKCTGASPNSASTLLHSLQDWLDLTV